MSFAKENLRVIAEEINMFVFNVEKLRYLDPKTNTITIVLIFDVEDMKHFNIGMIDFFELLKMHYFKEFPNHEFMLENNFNSFYTGQRTYLARLIPYSPTP
jgi:hypothetical protein